MEMKRNEYEAVQCAPPSEKDEETHTGIFNIIPRLGVETLVSYLPLPAQIQQSARPLASRTRHNRPQVTPCPLHGDGLCIPRKQG